MKNELRRVHPTVSLPRTHSENNKRVAYNVTFEQQEYRPSPAGVKTGVFACVGWQVILCDPIWQATPAVLRLGWPWRTVSGF